MKPNNRHLILSLCALALSVLSLPACRAESPTSRPPAAETVTESDRAAYLARIDELTDAVLVLKEESFISKAEYEARIRSLLSEIAALEARLDLMNTPDSGGDLPVSGNPSGKPSEKPAGTATDTAPGTTPPTDPPVSTAFHFEIREGRAVILAYLGNQTHVKIPAAIEGYPVTAIEEAAFRGADVISVEVPYSVSEIGWFAFADCHSLSSVTLPASVESIGYGAFDGCTSLTLYCPADSYAAKYAASFGLRHGEGGR